MVNARKCKSMLLANDVVRALLTVYHVIEICKLITGQTTVTSGDPDAFENREREPRKPTHANLSRWELFRWWRWLNCYL